jgi:hypothetical protein
MLTANLEDIENLVGTRPKDWQDAEVLLEQFILNDDGKHDLELVQLFNRRLQRAQSLNGPPGSAMAQHHPIQRFDS